MRFWAGPEPHFVRGNGMADMPACALIYCVLVQNAVRPCEDADRRRRTWLRTAERQRFRAVTHTNGLLAWYICVVRHVQRSAPAVQGCRWVAALPARERSAAHGLRLGR